MFGRLLFKYLSESKQVAKLRESGTVLGTRIKNGRKAYFYMLKDLCVEVIFRNDNVEMEPEKVTTFSSVKDFNSYLEREFKASF